MNRVQVYFRGRWYSNSATYACGYAYFESSLFQDDELAALISGWSVDQFQSCMAALNGSFSLVSVRPDCVLVSVDRLRSVPLFYGTLEDELFVSDDAGWVAEKVGGSREPEEVILAEYLLTGYVTGKDTLSPSVKQLRAGELLVATWSGEGLRMRETRYYRFLHMEEPFRTKEELLSKWDQVLHGVFHRLIETARGRHLVVPLSGGYDSRLIVLMLRRMGYDRVICFTYGRAGNAESRVSQAVAQRLGYRWEFIPYRHDRWSEWYRSAEWSRYEQFSENLSAISHLQDWPAVWELKRSGLIPDDSIFVPGHAGDMVAGNKIPKEFFHREYVGMDQLVSSIYRIHYSLWDVARLSRLRSWSVSERQLQGMLQERIASALVGHPTESAVDAASAYECWEWEERQAKFTANSVRVYDFWGYEWRMPLWDSEVMAFWERVPLKFRYRKNLYDSYVEELQGDMGRNSKKLLSRVLSSVGLLESAKRTYFAVRGMRSKSAYWEHPLCWFGIMPVERFQAVYSGRESINSFLVAERMGLLTLR